MASEDLLFESMFMIFLGFMNFVLITLNKAKMFFAILDTYYVIFLFLSILVSAIGFIMGIVWNFKNRKPYYEDLSKAKLRFPLYLGSGALLVLAGFLVMIYYNLNKAFYITSLAASIAGIILLISGLAYFVKEVFYASSKRIPQHS